jgi:hypothetical protein
MHTAADWDPELAVPCAESYFLERMSAITSRLWTALADRNLMVSVSSAHFGSAVQP